MQDIFLHEMLKATRFSQNVNSIHLFDSFFFVLFPELRALILAVKTLTQHTRATRTIIWCANQLVLASSILSRETSVLITQSISKEGTGEVS